MYHGVCIIMVRYGADARRVVAVLAFHLFLAPMESFMLLGLTRWPHHFARREQALRQRQWPCGPGGFTIDVGIITWPWLDQGECCISR